MRLQNIVYLCNNKPAVLRINDGVPLDDLASQIKKEQLGDFSGILNGNRYFVVIDSTIISCETYAQAARTVIRDDMCEIRCLAIATYQLIQKDCDVFYISQYEDA